MRTRRPRAIISPWRPRLVAGVQAALLWGGLTVGRLGPLGAQPRPTPASPVATAAPTPPLRVWGWRHQGPPLALVITRTNDCLRLVGGQQQLMLQRPVAVTRERLVYFTLTRDADLAGWAVVRLGGWAMATEPGSWLAQLAAARTPSDALVRQMDACASQEPPPVPVTVEALRVIHGSALVRDTLEPLLGPLPKALGVQPFTRTGQFAEAQGAFLFAPEAPALDSIVLATPARDWEDVRYTLLHEWGHRWHQRHRAVADAWQPRRLAPWTAREEQIADLFAYGISCLGLQRQTPQLAVALGRLCDARLDRSGALATTLAQQLALRPAARPAAGSGGRAGGGGRPTSR